MIAFCSRIAPEAFRVEIGDAPSGPSWRRHHRHRHRRRVVQRNRILIPVYARIAIPVLVILLGAVIWLGVRSRQSPARGSADADAGAPPDSAVPRWTRDYNDSLDAGARSAASGNLAAAEIFVDRAESFVTIARLEGISAPAGFLQSASDRLDHVLERGPGDRHLFEHVTSVRIELAAYRSSFEPLPPAPAGGRIAIEAPRQVQAKQILDPATLKASYLDATLLPEASEILLPSSSHSLADNVRVENVTIAGAAQTMDGIRWRNVTFINTRLRYDGGELSLQNVRFVRCRFGLPNNARGAQIATAVTLAPPPGSITITQPPPPPPPPPPNPQRKECVG
jgi:hypothetical protein